MKAPVFKGVGQMLAIEDVPDPEPAPGELVLRVGRCGICGTDLHKTASHENAFAPGTIIGHEFSGQVVAIGADVLGYAIGDHVAAMPIIGCGTCPSCRLGEPRWCDLGMKIRYGGAGQYALATASSAIRLPRTLSLEDGALVEPLAVARHGLARISLRAGASVLVLGAGPIGLAAALWSRKLGAGSVVVASRSRRNADYAMLFGASELLTFGPNFAEDVTTAFSGQAPEIVVECIGKPGMIDLAIRTVRGKGAVVLLGNCMTKDEIIPSQAVFNEILIQGSMGYTVSDFEDAARLLEARFMDPRSMVTDTLDYDALPLGFEALRTSEKQCKVMIDPWR